MNVTAIICGDPPVDRSALWYRAQGTAPTLVKAQHKSKRVANNYTAIRAMWVSNVPIKEICRTYRIHLTTLHSYAARECWPVRRRQWRRAI